MATGNDAVNEAFSAFNDKLTAVGTRAVLINLSVMAVLSASILVLFSILRPNNSIVYAPRYKFSPDSKRPPKLDSGLLSWIRPIWECKEDVMLDKLGMDAVVFLRFQRMMRWMFFVISIMCCGVLMPINVIYNLKEVDSKRRNALSMLTIQNVDGAWLYAHVVMTYMIHAVVYVFIFFNYRKVVELRWLYFRSPEYQQSLPARSIMLTHVSKRMQTDQGLRALLDSLQIPYPTIAVHIGRRVDDLPELIEQHSDTVKQLEQVLTTYLRKGTIPAKRPTLTTGGLLGMGGQTHDAIDYLTKKIQRLEAQVEGVRENIDTRKAQQYGFASFLKVPYAHMVAKKLHHKSLKGAYIELAPQPSDLLWDNMAKSDGAIRSAKIFGGLLVAFVMVLYTIPLVAVSALSNLAALTVYVPFLDNWSRSSNFTFSAVTGIVPPLLGILLQLLLPMIMRAIAKWQGAYTSTALDRAVLSRYFFFLFVTNFIVFSLLGVIFNLIAEIIVANGGGDFVWREITKLPQKIQSTYLQQSNYWLTFFPLRGFSAIFEIAQIINLAYVWLRARLFGRTPRQIREWCKPPAFDYSVYAANTLLMMTVALIYAPLAPLVAAFAGLAFFAASIVFKYELLYIFVTKVESGGRQWRMMVNRLLVALLLMQLFMCLTIALQVRYLNAVAAAPPVVAVLFYKWWLNHRFGERFRWYVPDAGEVANSQAHHSDDRKGRLGKRFGHPSLHAELMTPMVHKKVEHLLPQVYSGRTAGDPFNQKPAVPAQSDAVNAGGLTFAAVHTNDLELSRDEYLQQQREDAWETGSMASTSVNPRQQILSPGTVEYEQKEYFDDLKRNYMQYGPGGFGGSVDSFAISRQPTRESQENLLAYNGALPPSYNPTLNGSQPNLNPGYTHTPYNQSRESLDLSAYNRASLYDRPGQPLFQPSYPPHDVRRGAPGPPHARTTSQSSIASFTPSFTGSPRMQPGNTTSPLLGRGSPVQQFVGQFVPPTRQQGNRQSISDQIEMQNRTSPEQSPYHQQSPQYSPYNRHQQ